MNKFFETLSTSIKKKNSNLCVGLDPRPALFPEEFKTENDPIFAFNKTVIDATISSACAYKPNFAFYEKAGVAGIEALRKTVQYIPEDTPVIADAKRGDIGSTAEAYADAVFEYFGCDGVTLNSFLGWESVSPFLKFEDRGLFILCLTSNAGCEDFQIPGKLYLQIAEKFMQWNTAENCGLVVWATRPEYITEIRTAAPSLYFLIPGIGAQGGDLESVIPRAEMPDGNGYIVNVSRGISQTKEPGDLKTRLKNASENFVKQINEAKEKSK